MEDNVKFVVCRICGKKGRVLTNHLKLKHNLYRRDYEKLYNSPAVCYERQLIQMERNKLLNDKLSTDPYYIDLMRKVRSSNGKLPQVKEALQNGHKIYCSSEVGKIRNSEIMRNNHKYLDMQNKATKGKLNSRKFHEQKSQHMTNILNKKWEDKEWKSKHLKKMFDGSKKSYVDCNGNSVELRSSYELQLYNYLISSNIKFEYESIEIKYISTDNKQHVYTPDFYLSDYNLILEVKPKIYTTNKINQIKRKICIDLGYNFLFITENELSDLNCYFHNKVLNGT